MLNLTFFGAPPTISEAGRNIRPLPSQPKRLALLAYLSVAPHGRFVPREHLLDLLWSEDSPDHARSSLRTAIHSIRSAIGQDSIIRQGNSAVGIAPTVLSDVADFRAKLDAGAFAEALALFKGEFLAGLHVDDAERFQHWLENERMEHKRLATSAALGLAHDEVGRHNIAGAVFWLRRAETITGKDEEISQRIIVALAAGGNASAAIQEFTDLSKWLQTNLEVDANPETTSLVQQIRRGETPPLGRYFTAASSRSSRHAPELPAARPGGGGVHALNFRDLVENADDVIYRTDLFGCFTYTNRAGSRLLGLPLSKIIGRPFIDFVRADYRSQTVDFYLRQIKEEVESTYFEFPVHTASGDIRWLGQRVQLVRDGGALVGIQSIARDITVNRRARQFETAMGVKE